MGLIKLRDEIDEVLASKVSEEQHHLEDKLKKLDGLSGGARRGRAGRGIKGQALLRRIKSNNVGGRDDIERAAASHRGD
jgi:hypothetical protein